MPYSIEIFEKLLLGAELIFSPRWFDSKIKNAGEKMCNR